MAMLYPNLCYNELCYKWTALYVINTEASKTKHNNVLLLNLVN